MRTVAMTYLPTGFVKTIDDGRLMTHALPEWESVSLCGARLDLHGRWEWKVIAGPATCPQCDKLIRECKAIETTDQ